MKFFDGYGILAWAFLSLSACPLALAGPNCDRNPEHPTCSDGGGGDGGGVDPTVTDVDNTAQYVKGITEPEQAARTCISDLNSASGTGTYECDEGGLVQIGISGAGKWTNIARKGDQAYCDLLNGGADVFRQFSPTRYWYGNHQGCDFTAGTCEVFASMWVYRGTDTPSVHAYHDLAGLQDIGLIRIGGTGTVLAVIREGVPEGNPFSENRDMDIEALTIKFQLAGRNSVAAECAYAATAPGEITFRTAKVAVTP